MDKKQKPSTNDCTAGYNPYAFAFFYMFISGKYDENEKSCKTFQAKFKQTKQIGQNFYRFPIRGIKIQHRRTSKVLNFKENL